MHRGLVSVLPCGGTSCFGCIAFPLAFLSSCQKCPKHWSVSCTCVLAAMNCYVVLQKHSIGNKKKKKRKKKSRVRYQLQRNKVKHNRTSHIYKIFLSHLCLFLTFFFGKLASCRGLFLQYVFVRMCGDTFFFFFFFLSAYFTNHCDKTVTLIFISEIVGDRHFPN